MVSYPYTSFFIPVLTVINTFLSSVVPISRQLLVPKCQVSHMTLTGA